MDHGIYTELPNETRLAYNQLWRGMLFQDEELIKKASKTLGGEEHDLFAAMIADRPYQEIMDKKKKHQLKGRLKEKHG